MRRRQFLGLSAMALACGLPRASRASGQLAWVDFTSQIEREVSAALTDRELPVDSYLFRLASLAVRLQDAPNTPLVPFGGLEPPARFGVSHAGKALAIIQWRLDPGCALPPHDHPGYSVCTICLEGEARLRNFEVFDGEIETAGPDRLYLRRTHDELLTAGRVNTLAPGRDNIHCFEAGPRGARGLDITTLHRQDREFSYLRVDWNRPVDSARHVYAARRVGKSPSEAVQR